MAGAGLLRAEASDTLLAPAKADEITAPVLAEVRIEKANEVAMDPSIEVTRGPIPCPTGVRDGTKEEFAMLNLAGVFPPIPTAFDENGNLALDKYQENVRSLCAAGVDGIVFLGSNGEAVFLSEAEKLEVIRAGLEALPKGKLGLVGTGCESTRATIELSEQAAKLGAHAVMVIHPYYYKPLMTKQVLLEHYRAVAKASPAPVILYSMPRFTGFDLPVDVVAELSHEPNIIGIKDSAGNVIQLHEIVSRS
ncbi:MAG: dihydrodipicolinate synthase family protein, partial [Bacillota bacterium]